MDAVPEQIARRIAVDKRGARELAVDQTEGARIRNDSIGKTEQIEQSHRSDRFEGG